MDNKAPVKFVDVIAVKPVPVEPAILAPPAVEKLANPDTLPVPSRSKKLKADWFGPNDPSGLTNLASPLWFNT